MNTRIPVGKSATDSYQVIIGHELLGELPALLAGAQRVAIVHQPTVQGTVQELAAFLAKSGFEPYPIQVPDAEAAKTAEVAQQCWDSLGKAGFTRTDVVIGLGGGAVTDLAGFVAATWLRGVRVVQMPTTLLGMVDAAVGGKTGINIAAGKNLVGAFHPPTGVLVDLSTLTTLPTEELSAGMAEVIKCGFIADSNILQLLEDAPDVDAQSPILPEVIERAIRVKTNVVSADLHESGLREILNYGHTLAHAIERQQSYSWRHGHAVSVGMVFAAELSALTTGLAAPIVQQHRDMLSRFGLPISYRTNDQQGLLDVMRIDKKARGNTLRFVVLKEIGLPMLIENPDLDLVNAALTTVTSEGEH